MKIAVLVPCHGDPKTGFAMSLASLSFHTGANLPGSALGFFTIASARLPKARGTLVEGALDWGADYLFFLDADHIFPANALLRLLAHSKPVAACNHPTRSDNPTPTTKTHQGELVYTTPEKVQKRLVEQVGFIGMGMVLVQAGVVRNLPRPLFAYEDDESGEDSFFCRRLTAAGVPILVDHALSAEVRHIHTIALGHEHTYREGGLNDVCAPPVPAAAR